MIISNCSSDAQDEAMDVGLEEKPSEESDDKPPEAVEAVSVYSARRMKLLSCDSGGNIM